MTDKEKNLRVIQGVFCLAALAGAAVAGQVAGGTLFAKLQHLPKSAVGVTTLFDYWAAYGDVPDVHRSLAFGGALSAVIPGFVLFLMIAALVMKPKPELHGSARFANLAEIHQAGLLDQAPKGPAMLLGKLGERYLTFPGQQFASLGAPTRSGKGVSAVVPNLLFYSDSVVVEDVKLENWRLTAGFRAMHGQECYLFCPDSNEFVSHRWNALNYVRRELTYRVADILGIANILYPSGEDDKSAFWNENAQTLFLGLVLYLLDTPGETCTLPRVVELASPKDGSTLAVWIKKEVNERAAGTSPLSRECANALLSYAGNSDNTASGIMSTLLAPLNVFRDPMVAAASSGDDFDLRDVRKRRMSIYLGIKPNNLTKFSRLCNLFFSILLRENTNELPEDNPALKYQCLQIYDEFAALGRMGIIEDSVSFMAGYNMRALFVFQNKGQLIKRYGKEGAETLLNNCGVQICFATKDNEDAKQYSEMLGTYTYKATSKSRQTIGKSGASQSESDQRRALLLPQEIKEIGPKRAIISMENVKPMLVEKIRWYEDPLFKERAKQPMPKVPRLPIEEYIARCGPLPTRPATAQEVETLPVSAFSNCDAILAAVGKHLQVDFSELLGIQAAA